MTSGYLWFCACRQGYVDVHAEYADVLQLRPHVVGAMDLNQTLAACSKRGARATVSTGEKHDHTRVPHTINRLVSYECDPVTRETTSCVDVRSKKRCTAVFKSLFWHGHTHIDVFAVSVFETRGLLDVCFNQAATRFALGRCNRTPCLLLRFCRGAASSKTSTNWSLKMVVVSRYTKYRTFINVLLNPRGRRALY